MTLLMLEEEGNTIDHHPRDEVDTVDHVLGIVDPVRVPEIEGERTPTGRRIGNQFHRPNHRVPCQIQPIPLVMCQQYTINTRYKGPYGSALDSRGQR